MKMMKSFGRQPSKLKLAKMPEPCSVTPFRSPVNSNRMEKMSPRSKQLRHITENLINLGPKCIDFSLISEALTGYARVIEFVNSSKQNEINLSPSSNAVHFVNEGEYTKG